MLWYQYLNVSGTPENVQAVINSHAIPVLLKGLFFPEKSVVEACVKTIKIIYQSGKAPGQLVYEVTHTHTVEPPLN
jgi:hypothetical protein